MLFAPYLTYLLNCWDQIEFLLNVPNFQKSSEEGTGTLDLVYGLSMLLSVFCLYFIFGS